MGLAYVNGCLVDEVHATVSIFDHGFQAGDGVFEAVLVHEGQPFALRRHLDRLERSAHIIGLTAPEKEVLREAVRRVVAAAGQRRAKVRITVTAGTGPLGSGRGSGPPSLIVALEPLPESQPPSSAPRARVALAPWPHPAGGAATGAKTISYAENVVALAWARAAGASEALFANHAGNVAEGTGSNVFVVLDGLLVTPPLNSGCLAGVTRSLLLELTSAEERDVPVARLGDVTEGFLTSTTRGVQAIEWLCEHSLENAPGPFTRGASEVYEKLLATTPDP